MKYQAYKKQVELLLTVLPEIAKEKCFALHGGTAINLFIRNMPRLSVDIDMTYVHIEDRTTTLLNIEKSLERITSNIQKLSSKIKIVHYRKAGKLVISNSDAVVKIETNLVSRGLISEPITTVLCDKAQNEFNAFAEIQIVPFSQLYGGKICAALDRQHPRDLFDVQYLLKNNGIDNNIKKGFFLSLLSNPRPIYEILNPNFLDQRATLNNQFIGMTREIFTYEDFEETRKKLVESINCFLTNEDKSFLLAFNQSNPNWEIYNFQEFPAIQWKLKNLSILKKNNPKKMIEQLIKLETILNR